MAITKRQKIIAEQVEVLKAYPLKDAISLIQSLPKLKFNESLDISVNLGVDSTKSDQNVRGSSSLPHGIGKTSRVAVFAEGPEAVAAKKAGADTPLGKMALDIYSKFCEEGNESKDFSSISKVIGGDAWDYPIE